MFGIWRRLKDNRTSIHKMNCPRLGRGIPTPVPEFEKIGVYASFDEAYREARRAGIGEVGGCRDCRPDAESRVTLAIED